MTTVSVFPFGGVTDVVGPGQVTGEVYWAITLARSLEAPGAGAEDVGAADAGAETGGAEDTGADAAGADAAGADADGAADAGADDDGELLLVLDELQAASVVAKIRPATTTA